MSIQEIPAFCDFKIRDSHYFMILFEASISWIPRHFMILNHKAARIFLENQLWQDENDNKTKWFFYELRN